MDLLIQAEAFSLKKKNGTHYVTTSIRVEKRKYLIALRSNYMEYIPRKK